MLSLGKETESFPQGQEDLEAVESLSSDEGEKEEDDLSIDGTRSALPSKSLLAQRESKWVRHSKIIFFSVLFLAAASIGTLTYVLVAQDELDDFEVEVGIDDLRKACSVRFFVRLICFVCSATVPNLVAHHHRDSAQQCPKRRSGRQGTGRRSHGHCP